MMAAELPPRSVVAAVQLPFLQVLDDRVGNGSTIFVGQRPFNDWHEFIDDPLIADAVLDRLSSNRFHMNLKGDSKRRSEAKLGRPKK